MSSIKPGSVYNKCLYSTCTCCRFTLCIHLPPCSIVMGTFEARWNGPETNNQAEREKEPSENSTSGYKSLPYSTNELKEDVDPKEPSYDFRPHSSHLDTPQHQDQFSPGQVNLQNSLQETYPLKHPMDLTALEVNFFRKQGSTMAPVCQPFKSPDPGGGDEDLVVLLEN